MCTTDESSGPTATSAVMLPAPLGPTDMLAGKPLFQNHALDIQEATHAPILCHDKPFPPHIQASPITWENPCWGLSITNSDLELAISVGARAQDVLICTFDIREHTIHTALTIHPSSTVNARAQLPPPRHLPAVFSTFKLFISFTTSILPTSPTSPVWTMPWLMIPPTWGNSQTHNCLPTLIFCICSHSPGICATSLTPSMKSALMISACSGKPLPLELFLHDPMHRTTPGCTGAPSALPSVLIKHFLMLPTPSSSFKSLPNATMMAALPPATDQSGLAQWRMPSVQWARASLDWEPATPT